MCYRGVGGPSSGAAVPRDRPVTPRRRRTRAHGVTLALFLVTLAAWSFTGIGGASAASSFCSSSLQLQNWLLQDLRPGIDQYQLHPVPRAYVKLQADYLEQLAPHAPLAIRKDLTTWAHFAEQVADGASSAVLDREEPAADAASVRVQKWFSSSNGCASYRSGDHVPSGGGQSGVTIAAWVIGGLLVLLLVAGLSALARRGGPRGAVGGSSRPAAPISPPRYEADRPSAPRCGACNGTGKSLCYPCEGRGFFKDSHTSEIVQHSLCGGRGYFPCMSCNGTGVAS